MVVNGVTVATKRTKPAGFTRARQPEQRAARRANIVETARRIARSEGAIHLTISELGRRAQLTKASIYRYFESLEHVLLLILASELRDLAEEGREQLASASLSFDAIASRLARAYAKRPLLCELLGMVSSILEHNISVDGIAEAKLEILRASDLLSKALADAVPELTIHDARWVSHSAALYAGGAWAAAHPSKAAAQVLARPEFGNMKPDFEAELARLVRTLVRGTILETRTRS
jgi:AcrR family transcriptional regulator